MKCTVLIKNEKNLVCHYSRSLRRLGVRESNGTYYKECRNAREINKIQSFCSNYGLKMVYDNEYGRRSSNYRETYFRNHGPDYIDEYRCVYCGRLYPKDVITVDHLYPVNKVSRNMKLQKKLKKQGISSLNSADNLVAACWSCNRAKSDKMGLWILRGKIGRHSLYWLIYYSFLFFLFFLFVYLICCMFSPAVCPGKLSFLYEGTRPLANFIQTCFDFLHNLR